MEALELFRTILAFIFGGLIGSAVMYYGPIIIEAIDSREEETS